MESDLIDTPHPNSDQAIGASVVHVAVALPDSDARGACIQVLRRHGFHPHVCHHPSDLEGVLTLDLLCLIATPDTLTGMWQQVLSQSARNGLSSTTRPVIVVAGPGEADVLDQATSSGSFEIAALLQAPLDSGLFEHALAAVRKRRTAERGLQDRIGQLASRNRSLRTTIAWHRKNERILRRARNEAEIQRRSAEEANLMKSKFLASMSHEIRTPLTAIIGLADTLSSELEDEHGYFAHLIEQSGHRLLDTLDSVLILAKLEFGKVELERQALDVFGEISSLIPHYQTRAADRELSFSVDHPADAPIYAWADKGALNGIVTNLVDNALKYTHAGEVRVSISAGMDPASEPPSDEGASPLQTVYIQVSDTGPGIKPEFLQHIFDAFRQEAQGVEREYRGIGLGLSITKRLVNALDGSISVHSEEGVGTTFTVALPAAAYDGHTANEVDAVPAPQPSKSSRLLIVEDDVDTQLVYRSILDDDYDITIASGVDAAIDAMEQGSFDALLFDIHLGGSLTGIDLMRMLRDSPDYTDLPIAAVTAFALPGDRHSMLNEGFDAYLSKPFHAEDLLAFVADLLRSNESDATGR